MIAPDAHALPTHTRENQRRLVLACASGDPAAWTAVVRAHGRWLFTLAFWLSGSREHAEETVSETFAAAAVAWGRADPAPTLAVWLARTCYDLTGRPPSAPARRPAEAGPFIDPRHRTVATGLAGLPFELRAAIVLRCVLGFHTGDAACVMDVPCAGFEHYLLQGFGQLRERLGEEPAEPTVPPARSVGRARALALPDTLPT